MFSVLLWLYPSPLLVFTCYIISNEFWTSCEVSANPSAHREFCSPLPQIKGTLCVYFSPACSIHVLRHQLVYQWCWWRKRRTVKNASDHSRKVWLQWLQQIRAFRNVSYEKSILDTEMCHSNITLICVSPQPRSSGSVSDGGPRLWTSVCQRQRFLHLQMFWRIYVGWRRKELQKYDLFDTDPLPLEFQ